MTNNTASASDITWAAMIEAGIDIDRVHYIAAEGAYDGTSADGTRRVAFGPAVDVERSDDEDEADLGWDVALYDREGDYWTHAGSEWVATATEALEIATRVLA